MNKLLLLGDEAVAQAALDAEFQAFMLIPALLQPKLPNTYNLQIKHKRKYTPCLVGKRKNSHGSSHGYVFCRQALYGLYETRGGKRGCRSFMNSAISGIVGGLVFVAADDPSMHSSQNEQDSRFYGRFAMIPVLEPSNQQEAYDMAYQAFELSEKLGFPVMLRITTRLAHSRSGVIRREERAQNELHFSDDPRQFVLLPVNARQRYKRLLAAQQDMQAISEASSFNTFLPARICPKAL
jgi:indolepyruvate ferredoxin oxidoreductase alpha subunit